MKYFSRDIIPVENGRGQSFLAFNAKLPNEVGLVNFDNVWNYDWDSIIAEIRSSSIQLLIVDCTTEHHDITYAVNYFTQLSLPTSKIHFLTWDFRFLANGDENISYFPSWLLAGRQNYFYGHNPHRQWLVSCINYISRTHRYCNLLELNKQNWKNEAYITFFNEYYAGNPPDMFGLTNDEKEALSLIKLPIIPPQESSEIVLGLIMTSNSYPWANSFLNIVTETSDTCRLLSEKTAKALSAESFFTVVSGPGFIKDLRNLGFDVFDDLLDHEYYDNTLDMRERIKRMYTMLTPIVNRATLEVATYRYAGRFKKNTEYMHGEKLTEKILTPINEKIYTYLG
jgi:hypothetical protein